MTTQKLISLTAAAAVLAGLAYFSNASKKVKTPSLVGKPIISSIDLSDVQRIEIGPSGGKKLVLESTDAGWSIKTLFNYPADIAKIRENLLKLKDLKIGQVATGKKLDAHTLVDLQSAAGKSLATVRLGAKHMRQSSGEMDQFGGGGAIPDGRYVSAAGADTVFLVKETLESFDGDPKSWTDTQIASIPSTDLTLIELTQKGKSAKLSKKDGAWTIDGLSAKEELDTSKTYGVESALNYLNFNAIADPALTEQQLGMANGAVFAVALKNGEHYTAKIGATVTNSTDRYFKISASFTPAGTNATENATLAKKIETFNAKSGKWTYIIPSYSAENMTKSHSDLVKAKEEPKKNEEKKAE
jgi:hypothetical protein